MDGTEVQIKNCADRLVGEKNKKSTQHLLDFLDQNNEFPKTAEVLIAMAQGNLDKAQEYIPQYLGSKNPSK